METILLIIATFLAIALISVQSYEIHKLKKELANCNEAFKDLLDKYRATIDDDDYDLEGWND